MKLLIKSWNNGGSSYNSEAEQTGFLSYSLNHRFNEPAEAICTIADPDGTIAQKYNVDANDVYIGPGYATIEDPNNTDIFEGRIVKARHNRETATCTLFLKDWMDQLTDQRIDYDMRADLDGSGLRQSQAKTDVDGDKKAVDFASSHGYLWDDDMSWSGADWVGYYLIFPENIAGSRTIEMGPYDEVVSIALDTTDTPANGEENVWVDDENCHEMEDSALTWNVDYKFWANVTQGSLFTSISEARVTITYDSTTDCTVWFYDYDGNAWKPWLYGNSKLTSGEGTLVGKIPNDYLSKFVETTGASEGEASIQIRVPAGGETLKIYHIQLEMDVVTTGMSVASYIDATTAPNELRVDTTDLSASGYGLWEGAEYCIARQIYKHIDSAESPGDLITDYDPLVTLTCAATVEHTSTISTRHYNQRTPLEIIQDLAAQDGAVFWTTLGGTTVTYKANFNTAVGSCTDITDSNVKFWINGEYDYEPMRNKWTVYGIQLGDTQIEESDTDATSISKYGTTRSDSIVMRGITCSYDADQIADALVDRDKNVNWFLSATIAGLDSSYRLGTEVHVTSSILGIAAGDNEVYVVTHWSYDSNAWQTNIRLAPRSTVGYQAHLLFGDAYRELRQSNRITTKDIYPSDLPSHVVS